MKEFYIAPEVEILCFAPVEKLAAESWGDWGTWGLSNGSGTTPEGSGNENVEVTNPSEETDDPNGSA